MTTNEMTGGEALVRMLLAHEAGPMFGMGGFQLLPFYDAARRLGLGHNLINDERCAVFAADAYAKVSGRVGLADATLGPGAVGAGGFPRQPPPAPRQRRQAPSTRSDAPPSSHHSPRHPDHSVRAGARRNRRAILSLAE